VLDAIMCFSWLKPDPFHRKYKTSVKWKNLNPVFNEEFVFETKMTELPKQALKIAVWDKDYGKRNDYLGESLTVAAL
jgi:Ca2+-dependent lipid-binding protein